MTLDEAKGYIGYGIKEGYIHNEDYWTDLLESNPKKFIAQAQEMMDRADAEYEDWKENGPLPEGGEL